MQKKLTYSILSAIILLMCYSCSYDAKYEFEKVKESEEWSLQFSDSCTGNWQDNWFLDGLIAKVENSDKGMNLIAGPEHKNNAHHSVLWTKQSFKGDVKVEYEYTRTDTQLINVNILYIQAQGIGKGVYDKDISKWNKLREVPTMSIYYNYMDPIHISYAAFPMTNDDPTKDYIRVRKYPVKEGITFDDMAVEPSFYNMGLFLPNVPYQVTVIKADSKLHMQVVGDGKNELYTWDMSDKEPSLEGRIGLRHMFTRSARYRDFKVSVK
ncbi:DUF1961 family protein [Labilibaculum sp.]|uniref:DUF1961 family protein n=1 Tax=Labilibaculum sp. TaxID=2060723 RepID=UPI0035650316